MLLNVAAAALIDVDGRVLLQQRPPGKQLAGMWEFPGGKLEPGENPESCIIRELHEELCIRVDAACLAPLAFASEPLGDRHLLLLLYACRKWQGKVTPQAASALRWLYPNQMYDLPMPSADRPLIGLLAALI